MNTVRLRNESTFSISAPVITSHEMVGTGKSTFTHTKDTECSATLRVAARKESRCVTVVKITLLSSGNSQSSAICRSMDAEQQAEVLQMRRQSLFRAHVR